MYASALPLAVTFALLFNPPAGLSHWGLFAWLMTFAVLVRVSMTLYSIPSSSALDLIAFPRPVPGLPPPDIAVHQATTLGWIVGPGLMGLWLCTLLFLSRYRLTRAEHAHIVSQLARRAKTPG